MTDKYGRVWVYDDKLDSYTYGGITFSGVKDPLSTANAMVTDDVLIQKDMLTTSAAAQGIAISEVDGIISDPVQLQKLKTALGL